MSLVNQPSMVLYIQRHIHCMLVYTFVHSYWKLTGGDPCVFCALPESLTHSMQRKCQTRLLYRFLEQDDTKIKVKNLLVLSVLCSAHTICSLMVQE